MLNPFLILGQGLTFLMLSLKPLVHSYNKGIINI